MRLVDMRTEAEKWGGSELNINTCHFSTMAAFVLQHLAVTWFCTYQLSKDERQPSLSWLTIRILNIWHWGMPDNFPVRSKHGCRQVPIHPCGAHNFLEESSGIGRFLHAQNSNGWPAGPVSICFDFFVYHDHNSRPERKESENAVSFFSRLKIDLFQFVKLFFCVPRVHVSHWCCRG